MKVLKWLDDHIEEVFLVLFSVIMVSVIFVQVFMRYIMGSSLAWSEELARYCFIWMIYIGISYGVKKQRHIKVDVLLLLFKDKGRIVFNIISNVLFLAFAIFVVFYGYQMAQQLLNFGQKSPALQIPMGFVYMAGPVGMALTAIRLIQNLIKHIKALLGKGDTEVKTELEKVKDEVKDEVATD
ncbi:TRAP transporter small permease [Halalkalibacter okhensis]|uniref:C4-dicarboxylate ABC transporter n=1 Tax=Halalkalibacter okhensis TaxID=333138 RepID=A0A0B0ICW9_9BACI|nr:TRAP transporter small permease [Halalkalibacter okhensis]KHF38742.1 C4-dicarboxylate ABC transporter [Halalkalibacter okhensis]